MEQIHNFLRDCDFFVKMGPNPFDRDDLSVQIGIVYKGGQDDEHEVAAFLPRFPENIRDIQVHVLDAFKSVMVHLLHEIEIKEARNGKANKQRT